MLPFLNAQAMMGQHSVVQHQETLVRLLCTCALPFLTVDTVKGHSFLNQV